MKRHCVTFGATHQATVATKGGSPLSMMDGEEDQVTPKETRPAPKMAAWCEWDHPPQRTMGPSGG